MSSRAEHYREAERLTGAALTAVQRDYETDDAYDARRAQWLAAAQVHAILATVGDYVVAEAHRTSTRTAKL